MSLYLKPTLVSIEIFFLTLIFSIPIACILAFVKIKKVPVLSQLTTAFISLMRGTPLILQLLFFYFLPPLFFGFNVDRFSLVIITFSINYACYFAEIFRSGFNSIPSSQMEACKVLALGKFFSFFKVYTPQILKIILPSFSGEVITLVKDTALSSTLGVIELFALSQKISNARFSILPLVHAGIFYFVFNFLVSLFFRYLEKYFDRYKL